MANVLIIILLYNVPLLSGFNVPIKGLIWQNKTVMNRDPVLWLLFEVSPSLWLGPTVHDSVIYLTVYCRKKVIKLSTFLFVSYNILHISSCRVLVHKDRSFISISSQTGYNCAFTDKATTNKQCSIIKRSLLDLGGVFSANLLNVSQTVKLSKTKLIWALPYLTTSGQEMDWVCTRCIQKLMSVHSEH